MLAVLTKSRFLKGRQCPRRLWLATHGITEPPVESPDVWEERELEGAAVERIAECLFKDSVRIGAPDEDDEVATTRPALGTALAQTRAAIDAHRVVLQGYLQPGDLLAIADTLEPRGDEWFLWEVKASTREKPIHDWDLGFQWVVAEREGIRVAGAGLILLDATYVRGNGEVDPAGLLRRVDRTAQVRSLLPRVSAEIDIQLGVIAQQTMPTERPATRCKGSPDVVDGNRPSDCGHLSTTGVCGSELPTNWAGRLPRLQGRKATAVFSMADQAIESLNPRDPGLDWTADQVRCIEAVQLGGPVVRLQGLRQKLDRLRWPIAYVDFEFDPGMAVPRFPGCRPYDVVPFQWSMLVQEAPNTDLVEREPFLHLDSTDPRRLFAESLLAAVPSEGSIVAHSARAERRVVNEVADRLGGELALRLRALDTRFFDTEELAHAGYYHATQQGSYSIKKLAPALLGTGYEDLAIQDGMAAVIAWRKACGKADPAVRERLRSELLAYCGRDTRLMQEIVDGLRDYAEGRR